MTDDLGPAFDALRTDLADEVASLAGVVDSMGSEKLLAATPADGWSVADTLAHLAAFNDHAHTAVVDPDRFRADLADVLRHGPDPVGVATRRGRALGPESTRHWWHQSSTDLASAIASLGPRQRLPWYGPDMGAMTFVSARLMEHWAHGQDIRDTVRIQPEATARLRHVADLGVRTRNFSYVNRGLEPPTAPVRVELMAPGGERWDWGAESAVDVVRGSALGFALVVTQRRNIADTDLTVGGSAAYEWMSIAQAFAGGPTDNRPSRSSTS